MFEKINFFKIIQDHFSTLKEHDTGQYSIADIVIFFLVPAIAAVALSYFNIFLSSDLATVLLTVMSILTGLMFNLIVLMYEVITKSTKEHGKEGKNDRLKLSFLREVYSNISFSIFVSIIMLCLLLIFFMVKENTFAMAIMSGLIFGLLFIFVLTLLMILKRIHVLISKEFDG